jgi:mono/diheme cytochrome c family protein
MRIPLIIRTAIGTMAASAAMVVLCALIFIYSGLYNVSATEPHWPLTHWAIETVRTRSIQVHAANIAAPDGLSDPAKLVMGTEHFAAHCAVCHGAPGVPRGDIGRGLYPRPADLANTARRYTSAELFWILKNGIKSTGMPSWSDHSDEALWATVAFLERLPDMTEQDYGRLVMQSMTMGEHHHGGDAAPAVHRH